MQAKASTCLHVKAREKMEGKNQKMWLNLEQTMDFSGEKANHWIFRLKLDLGIKKVI